MLCKNEDCGVYRSVYDPEYDKGEGAECVFCGATLAATGRDVLEGGMGGLVKEKRPEQIEYVRVIDEQLELSKSITFIEGGTGVGKSYAYLVPVMQELLRRPKARAIICTGNKALQKQLMRDFPRILEAVGAESAIDYALIKGKNNYACPYLASEVPEEDREDFVEFAKSLPADQDNWPTESRLWWWSKVSVDNCPNPNCSKNCTPRQARYARVVIVNYHYLGMFLRFPGILMDKKFKRHFRYLVMDEGHQAASFLRASMKNVINPKFLEKLSNDLKEQSLFTLLLDLGYGIDGKKVNKRDDVIPSDFPKTLMQISARLSQRMAHQDLISKSKGTVLNTFEEIPLDEQHKYRFPAVLIPDAPAYLDELGLTIEFAHTAAILHNTLKKVQVHDAYLEHNGKGCKIRARVVTKLHRIIQIQDEIQAANFYDTHTAALDPLGFSTLPIDIGKIVRPAIEKTFKHVVVTSATLAQNGNDFSYAREQLGYDHPEDVVVEKVVGSPFNYADCARLYVPFMKTLPSNFNLSPWYDEVAEEIISLAVASHGDGLVLFSSAKDMKAIQERTQWILEPLGIPVVTQHSGTTAAACKTAYMETKGAMLYGLRSFWEGVDIQGSKLRLVIIPKLPFPVPDDPILKTLADKVGGGYHGFQKVTVPVMLETLRQGAGRLIRSKRDAGIIAILDSRFWTGTSNPEKHKNALRAVSLDPRKTPRGYGRQIFNSLGIKVIDSKDYACKLCSDIYGVMAAPKTKEKLNGSSEG